MSNATRITTLTFTRVFEGCYHIHPTNHRNRILGTIDRNYTGRKLWTINIEGEGVLVVKGHDRFTVALAKEFAKRHLLADLAEQAVSFCDDDGEGGCTVGIYLDVPTVTADALIDLGRRAREAK